MKLIFKGVVQGVGFRPTIYRVAEEMGLKGYVLNKGSEVEVVIDKDKDEFISLLERALSIDINENPSSRLANIIAQERAQWLMERVDELFF